jgi:hypothetical protein
MPHILALALVLHIHNLVRFYETIGVRVAVADAAGAATGTTIVHVILMPQATGDVLLPDPGHARHGLMRANWGSDDLHRAEQGQLKFLSRDAARIRDRLEATVEDQRGGRARE